MIPEDAVDYRRATVVVVHPAAVVGRSAAEGAIGDRRAAGIVVHPAAKIVWEVFVGIAAGNREAIQYRTRPLAVYTLNNMIVPSPIDDGIGRIAAGTAQGDRLAIEVDSFQVSPR